MDESTIEHIKGVIEALLFVSEQPVTMQQLKDALETVQANEIKNAIRMLMKDYRERNSGIIVAEIAGGYQMLSNSVYAEYIRNFYKTKHKAKLSKPALETLAIVSYKQPVTRGDVEVVRGVNSDGVMAHLLNKELIKVIGRKDVPGKPYLYGTTKQFLEYFGLKSLNDLPDIEDFPKLQPEEMEGKILPIEDGDEGGDLQQVVEKTGVDESNQEGAQVLEASEAEFDKQQADLEEAANQIEKEREEQEESPDLKKAMEEVEAEMEEEKALMGETLEEAESTLPTNQGEEDESK